MLRIIGNAAICKLFSLLLIILFALKVGSPLFDFVACKDLTPLKVEKSEKEEKKETEKPNKVCAFLYASMMPTFQVSEKDFSACIHHPDYFYWIDHFGSVPTPPPDFMF